METNWIRARVFAAVNAPQTVHSGLLVTVYTDNLYAYFQGVKFLFQVRACLPHYLQIAIRHCPATSVSTLLTQYISNGQYTDLDAIQEYLRTANDLSERMRGFPLVFYDLLQALKSAIDQQMQNGGHPRLINSSSQQVRNNATATRASSAVQTTNKQFPFLRLPDDIRNKVYRHLLARGSFLVGDWDPNCAPKPVRRRTQYTAFGGGRKQLTTYTVRHLGILGRAYPEIMRVNRLTYAEASKVFYGENTFRLHGTTESAIAFLHDRSCNLEWLKKLSIIYSVERQAFKGCYNLTGPLPYPPPRTQPGAWRRLFNVLVHTAWSLEDLHLYVTPSFWNASSWQDFEPIGLLHNQRLCISNWDYITYGQERNFLQHVARLGGVNLSLTITEEDGDKEKEIYERQLESELQHSTYRRPWLAEDRRPRCTCGSRLLADCCFWTRELMEL